MRSRLWSRDLGTPYDDLPDAPENCVTCNGALPEDEHGEVIGFEGDACTCSARCHGMWLKKEAERIAEEKAADDALYQEWLEDAGSPR